MIKSITFIFVVALATFNFTSLNDAMPAPTIMTEEGMVVLRASTPVSVQLNQEISSEDAQVGNAIEFMVRSNVTVNGKVVIAAGSIAEGMVQAVNQPCKYNKCDKPCAEITIVVESAQAVDGQRVNLRSIPHTVKADCCCKGNYKKHGKRDCCLLPAKVKVGTVLTSRVLNDVKINA